MRIIHLATGETIDILPPGTVMVLGFFDGVHLGHRALLADASGSAEQAGVAVWTFESLPKGDGCLLTTNVEKCRLLKEAGADYAVFEDYQELCGLTGRTFIRERILRRFQPCGLVAGYDFRFGRGASCTVNDLDKWRGEAWVHSIPAVCDPVTGEAVSSSLIRRLLEEGKTADAARMMGSRFSITAEVIHGRALGRSLGFPTINQRLPAEKLIPKCGVYSCLAATGGVKYTGVCNIGYKPTVSADHPELSFETWLMDYQGDLYGHTVTTELVEFLRPEQRFDSLSALSEAIGRDAEKARESIGRLVQTQGEDS